MNNSWWLKRFSFTIIICTAIGSAYGEGLRTPLPLSGKISFIKGYSDAFVVNCLLNNKGDETFCSSVFGVNSAEKIINRADIIYSSEKTKYIPPMWFFLYAIGVENGRLSESDYADAIEDLANGNTSN